jgi:hypothetical protein
VVDWCWAEVIVGVSVRNHQRVGETREVPPVCPRPLSASTPQPMVGSNLSISPSERQSGQVDRSVSTFENQDGTAQNDIIGRFSKSDGGLMEGWAEAFARLDPGRPPADVPLRKWRQFIDDIARFFDSGFAGRASALGWTALDLFGCDRDKPFARIDRQGLCWLIAGSRLVHISENAAIIETWTGAQQTWRRKPHEPDRVLAWELMP